MDTIYESFLRPYFFRKDAEVSHDTALRALKRLQATPLAMKLTSRLCHKTLPKAVECFGLTFPNQIGLAAGFDKNAEVFPALAAIGFGHVEIGTVTLHPQSGNEKPRIFRYPEKEALINRLGFPNEGADAIARRVMKLRNSMPRNDIPIGINIGKSKITPINKAVEDYLATFKLLSPHADYIAINVSSPNTPDLRKLQGKAYLTELLSTLKVATDNFNRPILVKIAPDLTFPELDELISVCLEQKVAGIIATNTLVDRPTGLENAEKGGLSGKPLNARSVQMVSYIYKSTSGKLPVIGVGGGVDYITVNRLLDAGAKLVQVYTGFVYRGPWFVRDLNKALRWRQLHWAG